ncbi:MAG: hypothetical protein QNJ92_06745 [Alphaproteobacteria bacterium]|nr:hypothetical protein [Alphaproteobacteria bacterium]
MKEFRYIPRDMAAAYRQMGWTVEPLVGHHQAYSLLAWRYIR